jgi:hypothetical protein
MSDAAKDASLELMIELKRHLSHAEQLRVAFDRLMSLGQSPKPEVDQKEVTAQGGNQAPE